MTRYIFSLLIFISSSVLASDKELTIDGIKVSDNVTLYRLNSDKGNTSSVVYHNNGSYILIDPNFNNSDVLMKKEIFNNELNRISYIASSHDHRDHIEQYGKFGDSATIIIPHNQRQYVTEWGGNPKMTYEGKISVLMGSDEIDFLTLPNQVGHTNGDQLVHFKNDKALYVGDYYFSRGYPIIDKYSGDLFGYIENLKFISTSFDKDTIVIPGHTTFAPDPMTLHTLDDLATYAKVLEETAIIVKRKMSEGLGLEDIQKQGFSEQYASFDVKKSFRNEKRWIKYLFDYFTNQKDQ